jgi:hypothetical protein
VGQSDKNRPAIQRINLPMDFPGGFHWEKESLEANRNGSHQTPLWFFRNSTPGYSHRLICAKRNALSQGLEELDAKSLGSSSRAMPSTSENAGNTRRCVKQSTGLFPAAAEKTHGVSQMFTGFSGPCLTHPSLKHDRYKWKTHVTWNFATCGIFICISMCIYIYHMYIIYTHI